MRCPFGNRLGVHETGRGVHLTSRQSQDLNDDKRYGNTYAFVSYARDAQVR